MAVIIVIIIFSVFVRQYTPARGFLCDDVIEYITKFGDKRTARLIENNGESDTVVLLNATNQPKVKSSEQKNDVKKIDEEVGIDLKDINCKVAKDVDVSYLYSNIDDSDEDLKSVVSKAINKK